MTLDELKICLKVMKVETDDLRPFGKNKNQVQIPCPLAPFLHPSGTDAHPSLSIKFGNPAEWTVFKCWACKSQGKLWDLVDSYGELNNLPEVVKYALQLLEKDKPSLGSRLSLIGSTLDTFVKEKPAPIPIFPERVLERFKDFKCSMRAVEYLESRNISNSVASLYDLRYDDRLDRVVFPVRTKSNQLIGAVGRSIDPGVEKRYHNYFEFPAGRTLGGINCVTDVDCHRVLIVEGFFDVLNAHQHLVPEYHAVCTWRAEMTQEQADLIVGLDKTPIICYDLDSAGAEGWVKAKRYLGPYTTCLKRATWENKELDFGDMTCEQLKEVLDRVSSAMF